MEGSLGYKTRTIVCEGCGKETAGHYRPGQRFCSRACSRGCPKPHRRTGEHHPCSVCGKQVYIHAYRAGLEHYFCSAEHANEWQGRGKVSLTCKQCGREFRMSASARSGGKNRTYCSMTCRNADPDRRNMLIRMNAAQRENAMNGLERLGYSLLDALGVDYLPQHLIGDKFCVDAFIPASGLVVQFDGDYWHGHPARFPAPSPRQTKRMALDKSQDAYMTACGYTVVRLWESDMKHSQEAVLNAIRSAL